MDPQQKAKTRIARDLEKEHKFKGQMVKFLSEPENEGVQENSANAMQNKNFTLNV